MHSPVKFLDTGYSQQVAAYSVYAGTHTNQHSA